MSLECSVFVHLSHVTMFVPPNSSAAVVSHLSGPSAAAGLPAGGGGTGRHSGPSAAIGENAPAQLLRQFEGYGPKDNATRVAACRFPPSSFGGCVSSSKVFDNSVDFRLELEAWLT